MQRWAEKVQKWHKEKKQKRVWLKVVEKLM